MRTARLGLLLFLFFPACATAQQRSQPSYWKGQLRIYQFNFMYGEGIKDKSVVSRTVDVWEYDYDLYEDPVGVVREELTHLNRNRSMQPPMDIRILDYHRGYGVVYDRGAKQGMGGPLVPVAGRPLPERKLLGFACEGRQYRWTTPQLATVELQAWTASDPGPKVPLLEVEYFTDDTGSLLSLTVTAVTKIAPTSALPPSLFEVQPSLHVLHVPSI